MMIAVNCGKYKILKAPYFFMIDWSYISESRSSLRSWFCYVELSICGSYYKSKLELKSNSSKILPVNYNFICVHTLLFWVESQT